MHWISGGKFPTISNFLHGFIAAILGVIVTPISAREPVDFTVLATAETQVSPPQIRLRWPSSDNAATYRVYRKRPSDRAWGTPVANTAGTAAGFVDTSVLVGAPYEYQIERIEQDPPWPNGPEKDWFRSYGYVMAGIDLSLTDELGKVILLVERELEKNLGEALPRLERDLAGDGWRVIRLTAYQDQTPGQIRAMIQSVYHSDPANVRSVFILGHAPVPYSGLINPDLHEDHLGAWPADVYYGDMDGTWTDTSINYTGAVDDRNHNVPGDGKFDQSILPSLVELEVGRVDLSRMPAFNLSEIELTRRYLQKNHDYRHGRLNAPRRALIYDNFGESFGDAPAASGWRLASLFGPGNLQEVGFGQFLPQLNSNGYLWSYGCGGGSFVKADGIGTTTDFVTATPKTIFSMLYGSYFGDWDVEDVFLKAPLASPGWTLATVWAASPHWYVHHMAMGAPIGASVRAVQNNIDGAIYQNQLTYGLGQPHVALMGDPTLRLHPVLPPANLTATRTSTGVRLQWNSSPDSIVGYNVYTSASAQGAFTRLTRGWTSATNYDHPTTDSGVVTYMVRAVKREISSTGSYFNASQGIFTSIDLGAAPELPTVSITTSQSPSEMTGQSGSVIVRRDSQTDKTLTVQLDTSGSATMGVDYEIDGTEITLFPGASQTTLNVRPIADDLSEGPETIRFTIRPSSAYKIGQPSAAEMTIEDAPPPAPPEIGGLADISMDEDTSRTLDFTLLDPDTPLSELTLSVESEDATLFPPENLTLSGTGAQRQLALIPAPNQSGQTRITLRVSDGDHDASASFIVQVRAVPDPPVIEPMEDLITDEDTEVTREIVLSDPDSDVGLLSLTLQSSNTNLFASIEVTGSGEVRTLTIIPAPDRFGESVITITASDGAETSSISFNIQVTPVNDPPVAEPDAATITMNSILRLTFDQLLSNDHDPDAGAEIEFASVSSTSAKGGSITVAESVVTYAPPQDFQGGDSWTYTIRDDAGAEATGSVTVTVIDSLRLLSIELNGDGIVRVKAAGVPDRVYELQGSGDFQLWTTVGTETANDEGYVEFEEARPSGPMLRIYRVIKP